MKTTALFIALFLALVAAEEEKKCPIMAALEKSIDSCIDELKPSEETLDLVAKEQGQELEEVQCFQACMMNKAGLMDAAKLNFDKMEELMRSAENPDEDEIKQIITMMQTCKEVAEVSDNECEVAGGYAKCVKAQKEAKKAALK